MIQPFFQNLLTSSSTHLLFSLPPIMQFIIPVFLFIIVIIFFNLVMFGCKGGGVPYNKNTIYFYDGFDIFFRT